METMTGGAGLIVMGVFMIIIWLLDLISQQIRKFSAWSNDYITDIGKSSLMKLVILPFYILAGLYVGIMDVLGALAGLSLARSGYRWFNKPKGGEWYD